MAVLKGINRVVWKKRELLLAQSHTWFSGSITLGLYVLYAYVRKKYIRPGSNILKTGRPSVNLTCGGLLESLIYTVIRLKLRGRLATSHGSCFKIARVR